MSYALRFNPDGTSGGDVAAFTTSITNNAGTSAWTAEFRLKLIAGYPTTGNWYILGSNTASGSGLTLRQASGNGALAIITGGTFRIASSAGYILDDGAFHTYRVEHDAGGALRFYRDGDTTPYFSTTYTINGTFNCNRFGAAGTTATVFTPMELEYFTYTGSTGGRTWRADLSSGAGDELKTDEGTNFANMTGFTTVDADKWINYGGGSIALDSALQTFSSLTADLTAQIQLAAQFTGVSSITASLQTGAVTGANLGAVATITAVLTTGIRLNSSMSNTSSISGVLSDAAPELPPQSIPVINSITPYSNSAAVNYSYSGSDATSYKGRINGGAPFTLSVSPAIIVGLAPETTYALEIAAENSVGLGAWSAPTNFTTVAAGSSDELIIRNIVRPYLRPVLKEIKK